ncbi:MAG: ChaN family lipoprotein [Deltaproteobacteria bacterium]|nr:ChaN family lipoprotein [Deltaproteobacteria bacterium]
MGCGAAQKPAPAAAPKVAEPAPAGAPWTAQLRDGHPLVGRIYSTTRHAFVDRATLEADVAAARFVLLGEKHDAPDHHRLQRELIEALVARGRKPSVVFEMLDVDEQPKLDAARAEKNPDAATFGQGWDWPLYRPIVAFAVGAGLPLHAGNYPMAKIKAMFKGKGTPVPDDELKALGVDLPYPPGAHESLEQELIDAHCGHLPKGHAGGFVTAQRLRDGQLAERLATAAKESATDGGAVLIAGSGHTRSDRGVPWVLAKKHGATKVYSIAFLEVQTGAVDPERYAAEFHAKTLPFDAVWFTPALSDDDPCAGMR